jgi:glutaredoxin
MKKMLFLALLAFGGYKFYHNGFSFMSPEGAFDKNGQPRVVLFTGPGCDANCESIRGLLKQRGFDYEEINVAGSDGAPVSNKYGVTNYPTTLVGKQAVLGDDLMDITAALMEAYGDNAMTGLERTAMRTHHDSKGRAKVVLYGTSWCPYCKEEREFLRANNIEFDDVDVERSAEGGDAYRVLKGNGYPLTYVGYKRFSGVNLAGIQAAVEEAKKKSGS